MSKSQVCCFSSSSSMLAVIGLAVWGGCSSSSSPTPDAQAVRDAQDSQAAQDARLDAVSLARPTIEIVASPGEVFWGEVATVAFDYADPDGDIATLDAARANDLGSALISLGAEDVGMSGTAGRATLPIDTSRLPFGKSSYQVTLVDAAGLRSETVAFTLEVVGKSGAGTAPSLETFEVTADQWVRPLDGSSTVVPRFVLGYSDPDADVLRARFVLVRPDGSTIVKEQMAAALRLVGTAGSLDVAPFVFGSDDLLGSHTLATTLYDDGGLASDTRQVDFVLSADLGVFPPAITGFSPGEGAADTVVELAGSGFEPVAVDANVVTLADRPVEVTAVSATSMTLRVPANAGTGRFKVRNQWGVAVSDDYFVVPPSVSIELEEHAVAVLGSLSLRVRVVSAPRHLVSWSVNGIAGGDETVGVVDCDDDTDSVVRGRATFRAPAQVPDSGQVTVRASLLDDPEVFAEVSLAILPPPVFEGTGKVQAASGGIVSSADGRSSLSIPEAALAEDSVVAVTPLDLAALPPAAVGRRIEAGARLEPAGLTFSSPATLTLPLWHYLAPGTPLTLRQYLSEVGDYSDQVATATVTEDGEHATAEISHFSDFVFDGAAPPEVPLAAPSIAAIAPESALEGATVPVRIRGENITPDLVVAVELDGVPSN
ncbi:MAG: IPT/TIG domain-containing protein, partial [Pseudomonadota bacterium]